MAGPICRYTLTPAGIPETVIGISPSLLASPAAPSAVTEKTAAEVPSCLPYLMAAAAGSAAIAVATATMSVACFMICGAITDENLSLANLAGSNPELAAVFASSFPTNVVPKPIEMSATRARPVRISRRERTDRFARLATSYSLAQCRRIAGEDPGFGVVGPNLQLAPGAQTEHVERVRVVVEREGMADHGHAVDCSCLEHLDGTTVRVEHRHGADDLDLVAVHTERRVARHRVGRCDTEVLESAAGLDPGKPVFDSLDDSGAVDDDIPLASPSLVSVGVHMLDADFASSVQ